MTKKLPLLRPDTRKIFERHHNLVVPANYEVHHLLPVRLGGTHEVDNLVAIDRASHAQAHLELYQQYSDLADLWAYHSLSNNTVAAHRVNCAQGGKASQISKRARGMPNGFQAFSPEKRKAVATKAGRIGGTKQRDAGLGIHTDAATRATWARLGALAVIDCNGMLDPARQSARGKIGGPKNKGFRWCNDGVQDFKYMPRQMFVVPFDKHLEATGLKAGRCPQYRVNHPAMDNNSIHQSK